jgi:hypothetical protein
VKNAIASLVGRGMLYVSKKSHARTMPEKEICNTRQREHGECELKERTEPMTLERA